MKKLILAPVMLFALNSHALVGAIVGPTGVVVSPDGSFQLDNPMLDTGASIAIAGLISTNLDVVVVGGLIMDGKMDVSAPEAQALLVQESLQEGWDGSPVTDAVAARMGLTSAQVKSAVKSIAGQTAVTEQSIRAALAQ